MPDEIFNSQVLPTFSLAAAPAESIFSTLILATNLNGTQLLLRVPLLQMQLKLANEVQNSGSGTDCVLQKCHIFNKPA